MSLAVILQKSECLAEERRTDTPMKILFLHIGTSKTATSSIQAFCAMNRPVLESKGFCYPHTIYSYPVTSDNRNAHFMVGKITDGEGKRDRKEEERLFSLGMDEIHRCFEKYDNVVMSEENIWLYSATTHKKLWNKLKVDAAACGYTIKIIVYLRRQDALLSSRWNQMARRGSSMPTWSEYIREAPLKLNMLLDYAANLSRIAGFFEKENIIVRRFDRDSFFGGTIYADFFHCLGLEITDEYEELEADLNFSLKGNTFEIMRIMNTTPVLNKYNNLYWRKLVGMCSEESERNYKNSMFSKKEAETLLEHYRESNERVATDFIGDGKPLFCYDVEDLPKWEKKNEHMLDDVIRVFTVIAYDLKERMDVLEKENKDLKKQVTENRLSIENVFRKGKRYISGKLEMKNK